MAAGKFTFRVNNSKISFARGTTNIKSGGDLVESEMKLQYFDGTNQNVIAGQILYSEGTLGSMDFFEISAKNNHNFNGDGYIDVIIRIQYNIPSMGSHQFFPSILGSDPFSLVVHHT